MQFLISWNLSFKEHWINEGCECDQCALINQVHLFVVFTLSLTSSCVSNIQVFSMCFCHGGSAPWKFGAWVKVCRRIGHGAFTQSIWVFLCSRRCITTCSLCEPHWHVCHMWIYLHAHSSILGAVLGAQFASTLSIISQSLYHLSLSLPIVAHYVFLSIQYICVRVECLSVRIYMSITLSVYACCLCSHTHICMYVYVYIYVIYMCRYVHEHIHVHACLHAVNVCVWVLFMEGGVLAMFSFLSPAS